MVEFIVLLIFGIALVAMGIVTATGNLLFIKKRNKKNVSEANRLIFGRLCGIATILLGICFIILAPLMLIFGEGNWILCVFLPFAIASVAIILYTAFKYNRK